jgi:hypothetical protein
VPVTDAAAPAAPATLTRPPADLAVRRLLRIPEGPPAPEDAAQRAFSVSILVSATRCILTYLVLPFILPIVGFAAGVGPWLGVPIGVVAIGSNVLTVRRFWAADHKWRWAYTGLALVIVSLLIVLMVRDLAQIIG